MNLHAHLQKGLTMATAFTFVLNALLVYEKYAMASLFNNKYLNNSFGQLTWQAGDLQH